MKELKQVKVDFSVTEPMAGWWSKVPRKPRTRRIGAASSGSGSPIHISRRRKNKRLNTERIRRVRETAPGSFRKLAD